MTRPQRWQITHYLIKKLPLINTVQEWPNLRVGRWLRRRLQLTVSRRCGDGPVINGCPRTDIRQFLHHLFRLFYQACQKFWQTRGDTSLGKAFVRAVNVTIDWAEFNNVAWPSRRGQMMISSTHRRRVGSKLMDWCAINNGYGSKQNSKQSKGGRFTSLDIFGVRWWVKTQHKI